MNQGLTFSVENNITDERLSSFNKHKHNKSNLIDINICNTNKGIQTNNALDLKDFKEDKNFGKCVDYLINLIRRESGIAYLSFCWAHLIEYQRGGYQQWHNHQDSERFSAILYLNTCRGGETEFAHSTGITISPIKNKMVVFPSNFDHRAKKTSFGFNKKKVLVLGII